MKKTLRSLALSVISLLLCFSMLLGSTFAWFTDEVESGKNVIQAGNLDIEMHWTKDLSSGTWINAEDDNAEPVFNYDKWEPGYTEVRYVKIKNAGSLAFKYALSIIPDGEVSKLADVIDVFYVENATANIGGRAELNALGAKGTLRDAINGSIPVNGAIVPTGKTAEGAYSGEVVIAIALKMRENAGNEYQNLSIGDTFSLKLTATQYSFEKDGYGSDYDKDAQWPGNVTVGNSASAPVTTTDNKTDTATELLSSDGKISASVPAGALVNSGTDKLTLTVTEVEKSAANITLSENENSLSVDVHIDGIAEDNTTVMAIGIKELLPVGLNMGNYRFYHVEDGATVEMTLLADGATPVHNNYEYDPATGDVVLYLKSFSEIALVADNENAWEGEFDYDWYDASKTELTIANADQLAAFGAIVGGMDGQTRDSFAGKTVKLIADINLGDKESENKSNIIFYPIGYNSDDGKYEKTGVAINSSLKTFEGTFDGNGHTVSNFYQNTWEMKGDHDWYSPEEQYYRDGMGLFGRVYGGTVKNLTVRDFSSDGEITTTGVIAAYADGATFENIAIFNCNPRVYNIGNGGIVGCVGWYAKEENLKTTFKNITVDNSNKISALWGSYDVACGGIVGQYYPTSGQSSKNYPVNAGISFENCHVSAVMDVYNDVCANYQYYAYRYTGMLIGSVRENVTIDGHVYPKMDGITAEKCTVHFGTWNDYYYCEIIDNTTASYTHDYQMSRLTEIKAIDGTTITYLDGTTGTVPASGRANYVIVDYTKGHGTENATCYHFKDGKVWNHSDAGTEIVDGKEVLVEDKQHIYLEFNNLVTGYGWGVTSKGVDDLDGVTILDREVADSKVKFEKADNVKETYMNGKPITIGDLFKAAKLDDEKLSILSASVSVTVSPVGDESTAGGTFEANTTDWTKGTLTFTGTGAATITITDYYFCTPTTITVTITKRVAEEKFDVVMNNGDFLHRVGNSGTVALDKLFKAKDGVTVGTVSVTVEAVDGTGASGTYSNNAIQFNGTGVVKVTITDNDYCTPTELYLEVVDAKNITSATGSLDGTDVVLLNDVKVSSNGTINYRYCTVYGNGFTINVQGGMNEYNSKQGHGIIIAIDAVLDNLVIVGDVYENYGAYSNQVDYTSAIDATNTVIQNCHISNCSAPVRANGVTIKNTTLNGGTVANLIISGGVNTLENVTTVNYNDGRGVIGFGIVISDGANENVKLVLNGELKQYNFISQNDISLIKDSNAQQLFNEMFTDTYANYHITKDGVKYVNPGILSMVDTFESSDITNNTVNGYIGTKISYKVLNTTYKGYLYSMLSIGNTVDNGYNADIDPHKATVQGDYLPKFDFDLGDQKNSNDGADDTRYLTGDVNGIESLHQDNEAPNSLDLTKLAEALKYGKPLAITVSYKDANGTVLGTDAKVQLKSSGTLVFTVTDNIFYNQNGEKLDKSVERTYEIPVTVSVKEAAIKNAEIKVNKTSINGDYNSSKYMTFNPLDAITITDFDANGTGTTVTLSKNIASKTVEYADSSKGAWGGATITITYTDGRVLIVNLGTSTLNSPGASNGGKTITIQSNGSIKTDGKVANSSATGGTWTINGYSFKGNNGSTVTNNTKVTVNFADESGCVTGDTLVMLADGTQKRIEEVTTDDMLLVWNFYTGEYDVVPAAIIFYHGDELYRVLSLNFSDGTTVKVINVHGFFDTNANEFVMIDEYNVESFIGHSFAKVDGDSYKSVELIGYEITSEYTGCYSIQTVVHINFMVEGMFSLTIPPIDGWFDYFEIGNDMKYDEEKMQADIEKYGLYEYEVFEPYGVTYEQFIAFNGPYLKVLVGRGVLTFEEILELIATYVNPAQ